MKPDRLLILACSQRKRQFDALPLAIDYYDGPIWQTLRTVDPDGSLAQVAVLSALYGLRDARFERLVPYDLIMTRQKADAMIAGGITTRWPRPPRKSLPDTFGIHPAAEIATMTRMTGQRCFHRRRDRRRSSLHRCCSKLAPCPDRPRLDRPFSPHHDHQLIDRPDAPSASAMVARPAGQSRSQLLLQPLKGYPMYRAYCDRSGTIGFTSAIIPEGTLPIAQHDNPPLLRGAIADLARVSDDRKTLLVPGVTEVTNGEQALDALISFIERVNALLKADLDQTTANKERMLVPRDGDVAHRRGYRREENPFVPNTDLHANWDDDWQFRERSVRGNDAIASGSPTPISPVPHRSMPASPN